MAERRPSSEWIDWAAVPFATIPVVRTLRCPRCQADERIHVRGENNGDGSTTEKVICAECSAPFKIVREPTLPEWGNLDS